MARTTTTAQATALAGADRREFIRVRIEDAGATLRHYTAAGGAAADWLRSWSVARSVDSPAGTFTVTLARELPVARYHAAATASTDTLVSLGHGLTNGDTVHVLNGPAGIDDDTPLYYVIGVSGSSLQLSDTRGGSAVAIDADGECSLLHVQSLAPNHATANPIDTGRELVVECAIVPTSTELADVDAGDWKELLRGVIDRANWPDHLVVSGRDGYGVVQDAWIEETDTFGGAAMETVMQSLITASPGASFTLYTPTGTSFTVVNYQQRVQSLHEALQANANLIGWTLNERWDDGTSAWRITFKEPPRTKTTPDRIIDSDDYFVVQDIEKDTDSVRNVGIIEWQKGSYVRVEDAASIAKYGRRPIFFDATEHPQITTEALGTALVTAAVSDLAEPPVGMVIQGPLYWPVQLDDLITFTGDVRYLAEDTDLAVVAFEHGGGPQGASTTFRLRSKPSGGTLRWHRYARPTKVAKEIDDILGTPPIVPSHEVRVSQSGATGTLTLVINDPDSLVDATSFESHSGGGDYAFDDDPANWTDYDNTSPFGLSDTVALSEGHNSVIAWAYRFTIGGTEYWRRGEEKFDLNVIPDVQIQGVSRDTSGNVQIDVKGDEDTADIYVTWTIGDGTSEPADPINTDDAVGGRSGRIDTAASADPGQIVWVKARGVDAGGTLAPTANIAELKHEVAGVPDGSVTNDSFEASLKIAVDKIVNQAAGFATDINMRAGPSEDRIQWSTGTIWYADGTSDAVTGADALVNGDAAATGTWFVYWNGTAMAYTQTWSVVLSATVNVLLATVTRSASNVVWTVIPAIGVLGVTGPPIQTEHLVASAITADKIAANAVTATKINVATLSAIVADLGTVNAGTINTDVIVAADTMTAATITIENSGTLSRVTIDVSATACSIGFTDNNVGRTASISYDDPAFIFDAGIAGSGRYFYFRDGKVVIEEDMEMEFVNGAVGENLLFVDAGSASATEQDWIEVTVGGNTGYIRVYATK